MTAPPVALKESIDIPWDDEDSLDESVEAALGNDEASMNEFEASTIHPAGTYSESTNDSALRFGIRFTTEQYHKPKLLKILSDANAPHYLYKEGMNWGRAARLDNYHFNPTRSSRKGCDASILVYSKSPHRFQALSPRLCEPLLLILPINCLR
jgi:hypothetical protein